MSDRLLVVAGARALDRTPAARLWAMRELAARVLSGRYTTVVQGRCPASPDEWADELAKLARLVRIAWPHGGDPLVSIPVQPFGWHVRDLRDADRYPYQGPLPRNEAMALWAGDQLRAGRDRPRRRRARVTQHSCDATIAALRWDDDLRRPP